MAGAVVAVNSLGDVYDWKTGQKVAGLLAENKRSFGDSEMELLNINEVMDNKFVGNTTIAVFFTNARFDKTKLGKIAGMAHDAMPVPSARFTLLQMETVFMRYRLARSTQIWMWSVL